MNRKLQQHVGKKFEEAGFIKFGKDIRFANSTTGIRKVVCAVIQRLMKIDPNGFGSDMQDICTEGEKCHDS